MERWWYKEKNNRGDPEAQEKPPLRQEISLGQDLLHRDHQERGLRWTELKVFARLAQIKE